MRSTSAAAKGGTSLPSSLALHFEKGGDLALALDPPCPIAFDGDMRIVLASEVFKAGSRTNTLTVSFPSETALVAGAGKLAAFIRTLAGPDWFAFAPAEDAGPSVISMEEWLDKPAGTHGGVRMTGDHFEFEDQTPVKFWGVNLSYGGACAPEKKTAELTAARFAKYGVNGVRLHKFSYPKDQNGGARQRLLDSAAWLHETQNKFYSRFVKAIRNAGYQGPLCGSPWQAPAMLPHYCNLQSDALVGYIDRHNYFGGGLFDSMLAEPGSGYFSTGLQHVASRPFGLSEWFKVLKDSR